MTGSTEAKIVSMSPLFIKYHSVVAMVFGNNMYCATWNIIFHGIIPLKIWNLLVFYLYLLWAGMSASGPASMKFLLFYFCLIPNALSSAWHIRGTLNIFVKWRKWKSNLLRSALYLYFLKKWSSWETCHSTPVISEA